MRRLARGLALPVYKRVGYLVPRRVRNALVNWLYPPGVARPVAMYVDVTSACNLRCPSCPVGNIGLPERRSPMDLAHFEKIIEKGRREFGVCFVGLFNWTEPFLHPRLPDFVRAVKREKLQCSLSTNLHITRNLEEVLRAEPDDLRISLSGFSQGVYGQTHAGGDIEKVKRNMELLSRLKKTVRNKRTVVYVYYHKYRHNLQELEQMRRFARSLGFGWLESWAIYMPLERVLELVDGDLPDEQQRFVDTQYALPVREAVETGKALRNTACSLFDQIVLDANGNVSLCCSVYQKHRNLGRFLEMNPDQVRLAKLNTNMCGPCMASGAQAYGTYMEIPSLRRKYEDMARKNLLRVADDNVQPVRDCVGKPSDQGSGRF